MNDILDEEVKEHTNESPEVQEIQNDLVDEDPDFDRSLQKGTTMETKGMNLGENLENIVNRSVAMTEMIKPQDQQNFLINNNENFEKFTDIN